MLIYDIEIVKAIPDKSGEKINGIEYCEGWHDHINMGVAVIGCYDYRNDRCRVFLQDNFSDFTRLVANRDVLVGFNHLAFDNEVLIANGIADLTIRSRQQFDILVEIWKAAGLGPDFEYESHAGYGLDRCCDVNFGLTKTGHGARAPVLWQQGQRGEVIDYCLNDVFLTYRLLDKIIQTGWIYSPVEPSKKLWVKASQAILTAHLNAPMQQRQLAPLTNVSETTAPPS